MMLSLAMVEGSRFLIKILDRRALKVGAAMGKMLTWLPGIWIGVLVLGLFSAEFSFVRRDIENWVQAGELTWAIPTRRWSFFLSHRPEQSCILLIYPITSMAPMCFAGG